MEVLQMNKTIKNLKGSAPMPRREEQISNLMKFYTYLVCLSGLALYPEHTRMFRQKNLSLVKIKEATGITDRTAKRYLYILEKENLIKYQGKIKRLSEQEEQEICDKLKLNFDDDNTEVRPYQEKIGAALWKKRNKEEKEGVYHIPRPDIWTPIPEETLQTLNEQFECSELELKLFLICCSFRDLCNYEGKQYKNLTFQDLKTHLNIKKSSSDENRIIRRAFLFLKSIGLIDFEEVLMCNKYGAVIPCFKLHEVSYYINYSIKNIPNEDVATDEDWQEAMNRIEKFFEK